MDEKFFKEAMAAVGLKTVVIDENTTVEELCEIARAVEQPFFAEGTPAMNALEHMVDRVGIANVMYALAFICRAKCDHLVHNWQDTVSAKVWLQRANFFDNHASTIRFSDGE